jgi:hypothetical protein
MAPAVAPYEFVPHRQAARRRPAWELLSALAAIVVLTVWYVLQAREGIPRASSLLGHGLGVAGLLLMLSTEFLYSLRKRLRGFNLGRTSTWLRVHIFTGIVGPYLVLLHTAGNFNGLAGILALGTVLMVASGFIGRYIYTAVPRTLDGAEVAVRELEDQIARDDRQLQALGLGRLEPKALAVAMAAPPRGWRLVLARPWLAWRQRRRLHRALRSLKTVGPAQAAQLDGLLTERYRLQVQMHSLAVTRRLLALWHVFHIPLGAVVFTLAFLHVAGALYYATFSG